MKKKILLSLVGVLFLLNIFVWQEVFNLAEGDNLKVNFLNIGQGDSVFIETPQLHQIIIDGGPYSTVLEKLQKLMPFYDKTIDVVILTHPDKDHLEGLLEVLQRYKIDYILWTGIVRDGDLYQKWISLLEKSEKKGTKIIKAKLNQEIKAGDVVIDTLHPFEDLTDKEFGNKDNDTGIISRLIFGKNTFLFTGDISSKVEKELVSKEIYLKSDVLKVAHHGSKYSTSDEFLKMVEPKIAVISVGKNSYGHPTSEVLQRLKIFGIHILRTDKDEDVKIISDGNNLKVVR
ncbi:MAG: MBL fold metallo-hydrolase [archaeon]|nr:MBL fold metallo-hydrolase [archaeon]